MKRHKQVLWCVVNERGYVNWGYLSFTRSESIRKVREHYSQFRSFERFRGLSDAQFWRKLKRENNWSVRRVSLRVVP